MAAEMTPRGHLLGGMDVNATMNEYELRALGALVEKQIATPDYYPMTLNSLVNACNQKNHRDPVVSYDETIVAKALDSLREKNLAYVFHGSEARAEVRPPLPESFRFERG